MLNQKIQSVQTNIINRPRKASSPISKHVLKKHMYIQFVTGIDEMVSLTLMVSDVVRKGGGLSIMLSAL